MNKDIASIEQELLAEKFISQLQTELQDPSTFHVINFEDMNACINMLGDFFIITEYDEAQDRQAAVALGHNEFNDFDGTGSTEVLNFSMMDDESLIITATQAFSMQYSNAIQGGDPSEESVTGNWNSDQIIQLIVGRWKALDEKSRSVIH